jgi:hypothetical protein
MFPDHVLCGKIRVKGNVHKKGIFVTHSFIVWGYVLDTVLTYTGKQGENCLCLYGVYSLGDGLRLKKSKEMDFY